MYFSEGFVGSSFADNCSCILKVSQILTYELTCAKDPQRHGNIAPPACTCDRSSSGMTILQADMPQTCEDEPVLTCLLTRLPSVMQHKMALC